MKIFTRPGAILPGIIFLLFIQLTTSAQMRQVYVDNQQADNVINKLSFYSPKEGYVAFTHWIGYTTDSGRTFVKKYVTLNNVDYNGYAVNVTFGFGIKGVKAFNKNTLIAYGDYGLVPAIIYSTDGGNSFKLIFLSQFNSLQLLGGISDMIFPQTSTVGYAADPDRILKTTNGGLSWSVIRTDPASYVQNLEAVDDSHIFALCTEYTVNKLLKTSNGGSSWEQVSLPVLETGRMRYAHFLTANTGWLSMYDGNNGEHFYKTTNGGQSWQLLNNTQANPFSGTKMKFVDENTGYALYGQNTVYKTFNGGAVWEPLPRDNDYVYLGYTQEDLQVLSASQLWAGGGHGFLELSTNGGGPTIPKAYWVIDTSGFTSLGKVNLVNYSRTGYTYQWLLNGAQISTAYNSSYIRDASRNADTIQLIVSNGARTDTSTHYQYFYPTLRINSFSPTSAGTGNNVIISGENLSGATSVSFGGVPATQFSVLSPSSISATVSTGASGNVLVVSSTGQGSLPGFTYLQPPVITNFSPGSAIAGTVVIITGSNFSGATGVSFGGVAATSFTVVSSTVITAVVPSGNSGDITLTTPVNTATLAGFIALPTITSFTPATGTEGTVISITGASLTGTTAVSIGGISALSFTVNSSTSITAVVGPGGSGNVEVTKPGGNASLAGFKWVAPPVISNFSPVTGPTGTIVTITGTGFNAISAQNIVYFGAVKARVTSGSTTTLLVIVPVGATFENITVTSNNLTAFSAYPFLVSFTNGGGITANSFAEKKVISTGEGNRPMHIAVADIDGDGKTDVIVTHSAAASNDNGIFIYKNTSTTSAVSFDSPYIIDSLYYNATYVADFDGDGKQDLVTLVESSVVLLRNTSTPGNISFERSTTVPTPNATYGLAINDIDADGKPDMAVTCWPASNTTIFRNTSEPGKISFISAATYPVIGLQSVLLKDIDNDKKPELIVPNPNAESFTVLKNNSTRGNIVFGAAQEFTGYPLTYMVAGDIDSDGKTDLVTSLSNGSKLSVIRNTSTAGNISFAAAAKLDIAVYPLGIAVSDMDGDGKADICTVLADYNLAVCKNTSTAGNILFSQPVKYEAGTFNGAHLPALADINGDGKNDAVVVSESNFTLSVYVNNVLPEPQIQSFTPTIGVNGTIVQITGSNFTSVSGVSFGDSPAASFTVNSATSITAVVGTGASGDVAVTNNYGTGIRSVFVYGAPPVITSISPAFSKIGSSVTVSGKNFSAVKDNNNVFFGGVQAVVTAATSNLLTVTVPLSAAHKPITVTVDNLTAYSSQLFSVTFDNPSGNISAASFGQRVDRIGAAKGSLTDMDGDGKPDLIIAKSESAIAVAKNTSTPGTISFGSDIEVAVGGETGGSATGDLDGDGKPDIVVFDTKNSIWVIGNTSSPGTIALSAATRYYTGATETRPSDVAIGDIDGDGKPDVVVANYSLSIGIFKNQSSKGNILLGNRLEYSLKGYPTGIRLRDLDGDGRPELIIAVNGANGFSVFPNTSLPGTISFGEKLDYAAGNWPNALEVSDLDGDGKLDLAVANINSNNISIIRNQGSAGNIDFEGKQDFATGDGPSSFTIGDLDGDGKPDLVESNVYSGLGISILKNNSTPGSISMKPKVDFILGGYSFGAAIVDVDGDGLPDISAFHSGGPVVFLRNTMKDLDTVQACANSDRTISAGITGTTYQWQQNTGTGFVNITDNANISGSNTSDLQLLKIPLAWNKYEFKCIVNGTQSSIIVILGVTAITVPSVTIATPSSSSCPGNSTTFTATPVNGGLLPVFQWKVNDINAGTNSSSFTSSALTDGSTVKVVMTSNTVCAVPATTISNVITMSIGSVVPGISVAASATKICKGASVTFTAAIVNGGTTPSYQWKLNGNNVGSNSDTYTNNSLVSGDAVTVALTSNAACVSPAIATGNTINIEVNNPAPASLVIDGMNTAVAGSSATISGAVTNGGNSPLFQWQDSSGTHSWSDISGASAATIDYFPMASGDKLRCLLTSNSDCVTSSNVVSNVIAFVVIPASGRVNYYPNPVVSNLTVADLKISDGWEGISVTSANGFQSIITQKIAGQTRITLDTRKLPAGLYVATLYGNSTATVSFKFIKL